MAEANSTNHSRRRIQIGERFDKWTVESEARNARGEVRWLCRCDCGNTSVVSSDNLRRGNSRSCGCDQLTQGGLSTTREYSIWAKMLLRCYREENDNYRYYGGRGTYVCQRWRESFPAFYEDMGQVPSSEHTLDRIETTGSYTCGKCEECRAKGQPSNCRWATKDVQHRNQRSNRWYTHEGRTMILKDWAREAGIKYLTLWNRLKRGVPFDVAISAGRYDRKTITQSRRSLP